MGGNGANNGKFDKFLPWGNRFPVCAFVLDGFDWVLDFFDLALDFCAFALDFCALALDLCALALDCLRIAAGGSSSSLVVDSAEEDASVCCAFFLLIRAPFPCPLRGAERFMRDGSAGLLLCTLRATAVRRFFFAGSSESPS